MLDSYKTNGTFTRLKFFECCKQFPFSGTCQTYPGKHSVWMLDGARKHCNTIIIRYFYHRAHHPTTEIIFGIVKRHLKRRCADNSDNMEVKVNEEFVRMKDFPCRKFFKRCGYVYSGKFDPSIAFEHALAAITCAHALFF